MKSIKTSLNLLINSEKINKFLSLLLGTIWLSYLSKTDSRFIVYALIYLIFIVGFFKNKPITNKRFKLIILLLSIILSSFVTLANYNISFETTKIMLRVFMLFMLFVAGILVFYKVVITISQFFKSNRLFFIESNSEKSTEVFLHSFLFILVIYIIVFVVCKYPGVLSTDSINQLNQIESGVYSNHHPYWHTMTIKLFYDLGRSIFGNNNAGVASYSIFQMIVTSSIVSYSVMTLYQLNIKKSLIIIFSLSFVVLPYNLFYCFTMWKDVIFGLLCLLFLTSFYRLLNKIGNVILNYILFIVSSIGFCLYRSNGWYAFVLLAVFAIVLFYKTNKFIPILMILVLSLTFFMQHNYLDSKKIKQPDTVEALSIPLQQVSRVIVDCNDLTNKQLQSLNKVIDVKEIKTKYTSYSSDNIKNLIRKKGNQDYLKKNLNEYLDLYITLGLKHPIKYIEAWVDQTKGYFNGGYNTGIWWPTITDNNLNIYPASLSNSMSVLLNSYGEMFRHITILTPFLAIGLHFWITLIILFLGIYRNNKAVIFCSLIIVFINISLLIATPLYSEFRYIYGMFTSIYFLILISIKDLTD